MSDYGIRPDGTKKGCVVFGELKRPDGDISTELSIGVGFDNGDHEIPMLVPTLSRSETVGKAVANARSRMAAGKGAFPADDNEPVGLTEEVEQEQYFCVFNEVVEKQ